MQKISCFSILIGLLVLLTGCSSSRYQSSDPFYASTGTWDSARFPLIKPYDAVYGNERDGWMINLPYIHGELQLYGSVSRVQKILVVDDVILVFTPDKPIYSDEMHDTIPIYYWYVMIPDIKIQRGFDNEAGFLEYTRELGLENIDWKNPDDLFRKFEETGCLDWIPDCK